MADRRLKILLDAIGALDGAAEFMAHRSLADYEGNRLVRSAVERQLEILGEACNQLSKLHPGLFEEIAGARQAVGLRNRLIHGYDAIDNETIHATVLTDLPGLRAELTRWLLRLDPHAPVERT